MCTSTHCSLQRNEDGPRPRETRQVHNWTFNRHDMAPVWLSSPTLLHSKQRKPTCIIRSPINCCAAAATVARAATVECVTQVKVQQGGAHTHPQCYQACGRVGNCIAGMARASGMPIPDISCSSLPAFRANRNASCWPLTQWWRTPFIPRR